MSNYENVSSRIQFRLSRARRTNGQSVGDVWYDSVAPALGAYLSAVRSGVYSLVWLDVFRTPPGEHRAHMGQNDPLLLLNPGQPQGSMGAFRPLPYYEHQDRAETDAINAAVREAVPDEATP
jgi:hypothetical protein